VVAPVIAAAGLFDRSEPEPAAPLVEPLTLTPKLAESVALASAEIPKEDVEPGAAEDVITPPRDFSDRVIAVDEFRARESSSPKPDRVWPRIPDRPLVERPSAERERVVPRLADEAFDAAILPPSYEAPPDGQRPLVLQGALLASLCLMLGFGLGYVYRDRVAAAATTSGAPAATAAAQGTRATTGTTPVQVTDVAVNPAPPAVGSDGVAKPGAAPAASNPRPAPTTASPARPAPSPATAKKAVATRGRLVVTSNPAKAGVTINGKWSGRTPLTLDDLKFGKYVVRVVQPGYEVAREQFVLSASSAARNVEVTLRRAPGASRAPAAAAAPPVPSQPKVAAAQAKAADASPKPAASSTGVLVVDSRPQGARVFIDGKDLGFTPLRLTSQPVGDHAVRLELANHHPWTNTAKVTGQGPAHVTGSLEPIR
jgi:hypothetical protein